MNDDDGFEIDVRTLRDFSFISVTSDRTIFKMHRLVQLATQKWLKANKQLEAWEEYYIKNLLPNPRPENTRIGRTAKHCFHMRNQQSHNGQSGTGR